jgi:bidirectional [NiFe] hydrogenase diaphorase subunit
LLAERNHICSVCVADGSCELQALASNSGVDHVRFDYAWPANVRVDATHDLFVLDENRCVLCMRCDELEGAHTWDLAGRGVQTRVITDLNTPWVIQSSVHHAANAFRRVQPGPSRARVPV